MGPEASVSLSTAQRLARMGEDEQAEFWAQLDEGERAALLYDWRFWARPAQLPPPGEWKTWAVIAGRGFGKTRCGAEWVRSRIAAGKRRIALVAPTAADARDVMVEGESGILAVCPPWDFPEYEPSKRRLTWPSGAVAITYSADEPERLRGPQHDDAWVDEPAAWRYPEAWDMLMFGLRLGDDPRVCFTTTPKPTPFIKRILKAPNTAITRGTTYENRDNLAPSYFTDIIAPFEGTRLGRQELNAELLEDVPGALWRQAEIDATRIDARPPLVDYERVVVAIDPAATSDEGSDETGIVVAARGTDDRLYVLADLSLKASPMEWATVAVRAYQRFDADRIIGEGNNGGDMIEAVIRTAADHLGTDVSYRKVTASRGKVTRAEPIAAIYEQSRAHHVGTFPDLEAQMCGWMPGQPSPDRMDALVWAATDLMLGQSGAIAATPNPFASLRNPDRDAPASDFGAAPTRRRSTSRPRI